MAEPMSPGRRMPGVVGPPGPSNLASSATLFKSQARPPSKPRPAGVRGITTMGPSEALMSKGATRRTGRINPNATSAGSTRMSRKKDLAARVMVQNAQGEFVDLTPEPLAYVMVAPPGAKGGGDSNGSFGDGAATGDSSANSTSGGPSGAGSAIGLGGGSFYGGAGDSAAAPGFGAGLAATGLLAAAGLAGPDGSAAAPAQARPKKQWTEKELKDIISIQLSETPTVTLFHMPGRAVWAEDTARHADVKARNDRYHQTLERRKEKDKFSERFAQTRNPSLRIRETQTAPVASYSVASQASTWDISDAMSAADNEAYARLQAMAAGKNPLAANARSDAAGDAAAAVFQSDRAGAGASSSLLAAGESQLARAGDSGSAFFRSHAGGDALGGGSAAAGGNSGLSKRTATAAGSVVAGGSSVTSGSAGGSLTSTFTGARGGETAGARAAFGAVSGVPGSGVNLGNNSASLRDFVLSIPTPYARVASLPSFTTALRVMEHAVVQNLIHPQQALFKARPLAVVEAAVAANGAGSGTGVATAAAARKDSDGAGAGASGAAGAGADGAGSASANGLPAAQAQVSAHKMLTTLMSLHAPRVTGSLQVTAVTWSPANPSLIAVGYGDGQPSTSITSRGCVCLWSPINPSHPVRVYRTGHSVTALEFASEPGNLLAVGLRSGAVLVFDVCSAASEPVLESTHPDKHSGAVWTTKWVTPLPSDAKQELQLMTVASDGTARHWTMKVGCIPQTLIEFRKMPSKAASSAAAGVPSAASAAAAAAGGVSAAAAAAAGAAVGKTVGNTGVLPLFLDVPIGDHSQYYVSTEEGAVYKCSVSYNEQTLDSYAAHTGPVLRVRCSPFLSSVFLTCSADWTSLLWHHKIQKPVLPAFQSGHEAVLDIEWSPTNSCVFATAARSGRIDLWDISVSCNDPVASVKIGPAVVTAGAVAAGGLGSRSAGSAAAEAAAATGAPVSVERVPVCLSFNPEAAVVAVGCSDGSVQLFHIVGVALGAGGLSKQDQATRLSAAIAAHSDHLNLNLDNGN